MLLKNKHAMENEDFDVTFFKASHSLIGMAYENLEDKMNTYKNVFLNSEKERLKILQQVQLFGEYDNEEMASYYMNELMHEYRYKLLPEVYDGLEMPTKEQV